MKFFCAAALLVAGPACAADWSITQASTLGFSGTETGSPFTGQFGQWGGTIAYDPAHPEAAKLHITIAMASAKTGDTQRDSALPGADWFNVAAFPQAVFDATGFAPQGGDKFLTHGTLTIRGIAKPVDLSFTLDIAGAKATAKGSASLTRTDFGVGQGEWASGDYVGLPVQVSFNIIALAK